MKDKSRDYLFNEELKVTPWRIFEALNPMGGKIKKSLEPKIHILKVVALRLHVNNNIYCM
jgi:hypothetical protein